MSDFQLNRRSLLQSAALGLCVPATGMFSRNAHAADEIESYPAKGAIRQSVSRWCFGRVPLPEMIEQCKKFGMVGIDLLGPDDWGLMLEKEMIVSMGNVPGNGGIPSGFNRIENHDKLYEIYAALIPVAAEKKVPNLICFSGERKGISDEQGLENCVIGLKRIAPIAEKHGVTICMELLNDKDHPDYQCDRTPWGAEMCRKVGSERIKLLYDIYHMQRMEGEIINTIRKYKDVIAHYHTAGNPGRRDLDNEQEINYPPIMRAILETGFKGFVAHEFSPKKGFQSLRDAVVICDV